MLFTKCFYKLLTGRDFKVSLPISRQSHHIIIAHELTDIALLKHKRLHISVPPGYGKSTMLQFFVAWTMAKYPDSNFLYISYSHSLATKNTAAIKQIIELPDYYEYFGVCLRKDSQAKDNFATNFGGTVKAFGSQGGITGQDAGLPDLDRFSGCVLMDDMHKPDEVHSDTMRNNVKNNYNETIKQRPRGPNVSILSIGQRLHEDDLYAFLISHGDGEQWRVVSLPALDIARNALDPSKHTKEYLEREEKINPYVFSSQFQQNPQPAGGGIFKPEWFELLTEEPEMLATFITADTAETDKNYNDATVFSFWGLYKLQEGSHESDIYCLHWIDCNEDWMEPKDLKPSFLTFYAECMRYAVKPKFVAIERKSTGTTLISLLKDMRGLNVIEIERNANSGSKVARFLEVQPYVAQRLISLPQYARHTNKVIEHCRKITANDSHRYDDIADTLADSIKIALIDKVVINMAGADNKQNAAISLMAQQFKREQRVRSGLWRK